MKYKPGLGILPLTMIMAESAFAADFNVLGSIPAIINIVILIGALACLSVAIKLFGLVKGGALAKGCQMWIISFITLTAGQVLILAQELKLFTLTFDIAGILYVGTVILWLIGLMHARRVLG
ncbi:MAG: hypothetical protein V3V99_00880 [candidate division Zixibacteria bacterium]